MNTATVAAASIVAAPAIANPTRKNPALTIEEELSLFEKDSSEDGKIPILHAEIADDSTLLDCDSLDKQKRRNTFLNKRSFELTREEEEALPRCGHFRHGDKPAGVVSSKILNSVIFVEVEWEKRKLS